MEKSPSLGLDSSLAQLGLDCREGKGEEEGGDEGYISPTLEEEGDIWEKVGLLCTFTTHISSPFHHHTSIRPCRC